MKSELDKIRKRRFSSLVEQIEFYLWKDFDGEKLSAEQIEHLKELSNTISTFGEAAACWYLDANEIIKKYEKEL